MRARDIEPVLEKRRALRYDQLFCNYINSMGEEPEVYRRIRDLFLNDSRFKDYTHLVIAPDDLIVDNQHIDKLVKDLEEFDYPVLSGVCNVDMGANRNKYAICIRNLPNRQWDDGTHRNNGKMRIYDWATDNDIKDGNIFKVLFSGFPLMFIRRDIVASIPFETDYAWNNETDPAWAASIDVMFNTRCYEMDIPIMVDSSVNMIHLRYGGKIKVGIKNKSIDWIQYGAKIIPKNGWPEHSVETVFFEKVDTVRLVVAMSIREEAQFLPRTFESLLKLRDIDAVYIMDGSYMKGYHEKSDSQDGTQSICRAYEKKFKEFLFRPASGVFYESQSQKRNALFDWIEQYDSDQELWIMIIDGDEELQWNVPFFDLKGYLKKCDVDLIFMQTNPAPLKDHPMENTGVRIIRGKKGIRWAKDYSMRYVDKDGNLLADYSPKVHITTVPHKFLKQIYIKNNWHERPIWRIQEKQKFLKERSGVSNERKAEDV